MNRVVKAAGSRGLTAYLLFAYSVFLVFLIIWGARIPVQIVVNISKLAPFWLLYLVFGSHLLACLWLFWATVRQRCSLESPPPAVMDRLDLNPSVDWVAAARKGRLRLRWLSPGQTAVLFRNRWSSAGTVLFHGALFLLPLAFVTSRATRFKGEAWIVEGHSFTGQRAEYTLVEPAGEGERRAPRLEFDVETVAASFWGDRLFFTDLRALIVVREGESRSPRWITLPGPTWVGGTRVAIRGFNYTPAFELTSPDGALLASGDLNLRIFPTGTEDSFALPGLPHRAWVRLYPDSDGPASTPLNRGFDLRNPLFHVAVTCGKRLAARGWLRVGEPLRFDGYRLAFTAIRKGGDILIHRDWGYPILWLAISLALAGTAARLVFPSTRVWLRREGGAMRASVRDDPFSGGCGKRFIDSLAEGGPG